MNKLAVNWCAIWIAIQELGAALAPLLDAGNPPDWAHKLDEALDEALQHVEEHCPEAQESGDAR